MDTGLLKKEIKELKAEVDRLNKENDELKSRLEGAGNFLNEFAKIIVCGKFGEK